VPTLSTPTGIAAGRIKRDHVAAVPQAAEAAEMFVERAVVTARKR